MAKTEVKMEVISKETIKPSSPTPTHLKTFKLSLLDQLAMDQYTPLMLFYKSNKIFANYSHRLKESLSETLSQYYPYAGRLGKDGVTVDCGDQGVVFVEARISDCAMSDFQQKLDFEMQSLLFPTGFFWKGSCVDNCLLAAQVTTFACQGVAVTLAISHKLADGATISTFLSDWAANSHGKVTQPAVFVAGTIPSLDFPFKVPEIVIPTDKPCINRRYSFNSQKIAALKSIALFETATKVEIVTAFLYKCAITAAYKAKTGCFGRSLLIQIVNMRRRMSPPLPENSVGNFAWYFTTSNDSQPNLNNLVIQLKDGLKELCNGGDNLDLNDWLMDVKASADNTKELFDDVEVYRCTSFCRWPFYKTDFGWGNPIWVGMPDVLVKNTFVLFDTPDGEGVEAMVILEEEDMKQFESDEELLEFALLDDKH